MAQFHRLVDFTSERCHMTRRTARFAIMASAALPLMTTLIKKLIAFNRSRALVRKRLNYITDLRMQIRSMENNCHSKITEERAVEITSLSFDELQSKLQSGELTCVEVLYAYQRVAIREHHRLNLITQPVVEAEEQARKLDSLSPEEKKKLPLFGIPISVKENYKMAGYDSTIGCARFIGEDCTVTSGLVQGLVNAGAVPFIRTNIPQTMMSLAAHNPIYGQSLNPQDLKRSPGGSSAGEGSAIGAGASILGLGSDIGGSVRVPAAWCGICALKPTAGRFSVLNNKSAIYGQTGVKGTSGLMSRDVSSLVAATRVTFSDMQFNVDASLPRAYFHEEEYSSTRPLTIGYVHDWPPAAATESTKDAITRIVTQLSSQGHTVVKWDMPEFEDIPGQLLLQAYFGDGGAQMVELLDGEEVSYVIRRLMQALRTPVWLKRKLGEIFGWMIPSWWKQKYLIGLAGVKDVDEWFKLQIKINKYKQVWIDDWQKKGIDVIITPAVPVPAEIIDEVKACSSGCGGYAYLPNMLNFPAGVLPFGKITAEDEQKDMANYPECDSMHSRLKEMIPGSAGLSLGVQCVTLPYREELCLRVMNLISKLDQSR